MTLFEEILLPTNLQLAWQRVKRNKGSAGCDGIRIEDYPKWAQAHWSNIKRGLHAGNYCPQAVKRIEIPKPNGGIRLLGIPSVNDRVIQQAIMQQLQALIDPSFRIIVTDSALNAPHNKPLRQCNSKSRQNVAMPWILTYQNSLTKLTTIYSCIA